MKGWNDQTKTLINSNEFKRPTNGRFNAKNKNSNHYTPLICSVVEKFFSSGRLPAAFTTVSFVKIVYPLKTKTKTTMINSLSLLYRCNFFEEL